MTTGVLVENCSVPPFIVRMLIFVLNGPTDFGVKFALKEKVSPIARVLGNVYPNVLKLVLSSKFVELMVRGIFALQVITVVRCSR